MVLLQKKTKTACLIQAQTEGGKQSHLFLLKESLSNIKNKKIEKSCHKRVGYGQFKNYFRELNCKVSETWFIVNTSSTEIQQEDYKKKKKHLLSSWVAGLQWD